MVGCLPLHSKTEGKIGPVPGERLADQVTPMTFPSVQSQLSSRCIPAIEDVGGGDAALRNPLLPVSWLHSGTAPLSLLSQPFDLQTTGLPFL